MERIIQAVARLMAILGGIVLIALITLTCVSVIGRLLNTIAFSDLVRDNFDGLHGFLKTFGPVNGDYELVEAGIAFAILAFFPWCQLARAHASVDVFTSFLPSAGNRFLDLVWELLLTLVIILITWRMMIGASDKLRYGETSFLLQFPVWWAYAACSAAAAIAAIVSVYSLWLRFGEMRQSARDGRTVGGVRQ